MNYYAIVSGINSICALTIAIIIFFKQTRKPVHLTYAFFYLLLFLWASFYFMWGIQKEFDSSLFWMRLLEYPVCFIHIAYLHFVLLFSETIKKFKKLLLAGYALSTIFFFINSQYGFFDLSYVRDKTPFYFWPHATHFLSTFIAFQVVCILFSFIILFKAIEITYEPLKTRLKLFLVLAIVGWAGGLTNWFHFYDSTPIPPIGNPAVTIYLIGTAYLIFKHDILGLNLAIKRTFVYTVLTLSISLIYALFVAISEKLFQSYMGYSSLIGSFSAALFIAVIFNPLREILSKWIDRRFFGKSIGDLSMENVQMKSQLKNQDQMKAVATLAAGMAHEIKNPLTVIKTFTDHLAAKSHDPNFLKNFSKMVGPEVIKIDSIVKQLLEFSKPAPPHFERIDITTILDDTLCFLGAEITQRKIKLMKSLSRTNSLINGDRKQLQQAFLNLLLNSIQAMPDGGNLEVSSSTNAERLITVSISDTGSGISKENLPHIFDPFFTTKESGTGLGLAITHGILKEHGCKIKVTSRENFGTLFEISFSGFRPI